MKDKILEDLKNAMKAQDKEKLSVIRMLKGEMQLEEIKKKEELTDEEVISVISHQIKTRKDSICEFEKANRMDLVTKTENEVKILTEYLPKQLTDEEALEIIDAAFEEVKPTSAKEMGLIMKNVSAKLKGKYDMGKASNIIKEKLNKIA